MRTEPPPRLPAPVRPSTDGWLGLRELPGYRAGNVVARLEDLPAVDPEHLYIDVLLLGPGGLTQDFHSGPCVALQRGKPVDERSRFVRVVAELVRHAPNQDGGLTPLGQALAYVRERGIDTGRLITAAQLFDNVSSESAVASSLADMLELSLGADEAWREMCPIVDDLARSSGFEAFDALATEAAPVDASLQARVDAINDGGLPRQLAYIVRTVGKSHARSFLRRLTDFEMVPTPAMFGV